MISNFYTLVSRLLYGCRTLECWNLYMHTLSAMLLTAALSSLAFAQPNPQFLTLDAALRAAEIRSQTLPAQDAAAAAARNMGIAAGQRPDPILKAGINNLPINGSDQFSTTSDFMTMRSIGVMQEFTREDKLKARRARFEREAETAEASRDLALANLRRDTAIAWLDRYYQERIRHVLIQERDEAKLQIIAADAAYRGGRGSQADTFAARSNVAQIEDRLALNRRQIATATTQLSRWIGTTATSALSVPPNLNAVRISSKDLDSQLAHHPQIKILSRQEAMAQADAEVALANKKSDVAVEIMYNQRGPTYSNMISFNLLVPLQWDQENRQDRVVAAKLAVVTQVRAERIEVLRTITAEALSMLEEWHSERGRLTHYDASLLPLATERTRAAIAAYRGGSGPLMAVLDARRSEIDTRMGRLRIEMQAARLWAQMNYLMPLDLNTSSVTRR